MGVNPPVSRLSQNWTLDRESRLYAVSLDERVD
jgi:hypothetical protein